MRLYADNLKASFLGEQLQRLLYVFVFDVYVNLYFIGEAGVVGYLYVIFFRDGFKGLGEGNLGEVLGYPLLGSGFYPPKQKK